LRIQVKDNGVGIPKHAIDHVFKPNGSASSNSSLGLRNVNQRMEHIYGPACRIQIDSASHKGTTITVTLPGDKPLGSAVGEPK
jgi:sensor histidine kinase YesM